MNNIKSAFSNVWTWLAHIHLAIWLISLVIPLPTAGALVASWTEQITLSPAWTATLWALFGSSVTAALAMTLARRFPLRSRAGPIIKITVPRDGGGVDREFVVHGETEPPLIPLQVLVWSPDGLWYRQQTPRFDSQGWSAKCYFGNASTRAGTVFRLVAIDGTKAVSKDVAALPSGVAMSPIVNVRLR